MPSLHRSVLTPEVDRSISAITPEAPVDDLASVQVWRQPDYAAAVLCCQTCVMLRRQHPITEPEALWALLAMALLLASEGENERAIELYALASRYPLVAKSRWFADVLGYQLAAAAAALPAERVAIAEERGRTRDLEATAAELLTELCR
ncbi:MAG: hypothetical protein JSV36_13465 [Anaerolineae bacterium]|nr:MAG: hypothetical protein JSV36_13465 [Anaerolineae bacterium]